MKELSALPPPHCGFPPSPPHCAAPPAPHCGMPPNPAPSVNPFLALLLLVLSFLLAELFGTSQPNKSNVAALPAPKKKSHLRVAYVSVLGTACGISTYNQYLLTELSKLADVHVFAETDSDASPDPSWVTRCWSRHEHPKIALLDAVTAYQPDVVLVGHEFGFWPEAYKYTQFVSALQRRGLKVVTTMHSVWAHLDKTVQESGSDALIVHSHAAAMTLAQKGIGKNKVSVVPHGSGILSGTPEAPALAPALWNTWAAPVIYTAGFALYYKGSLRLLDILAKLKSRHPGIHLVMQLSTNPHNAAEHAALFADLDAKIAALGLEADVTIHKGFVPEEVMLSHIRTAKVVVLPYRTHPDHDVKGTSGIARHVIATTTPLVVSNVGLFSDLDGLAAKCDSDDEFANAISEILDTDREKPGRDAARIAFLRRTSWCRTAEKYAGVLSAVSDI